MLKYKRIWWLRVGLASTGYNLVAVAQRLDLPAGRQGTALFMEFYVYIVRSRSSGKYYTGMTLDFNRHLKEHNGNTSSTLSTKYLHDYYPIYVEIVKNRTKARKLEKYLKSGAGREFRAEIVKYTL